MMKIVKLCYQKVDFEISLDIIKPFEQDLTDERMGRIILSVRIVLQWECLCFEMFGFGLNCLNQN